MQCFFLPRISTRRADLWARNGLRPQPTSSAFLDDTNYRRLVTRLHLSHRAKTCRGPNQGHKAGCPLPILARSIDTRGIMVSGEQIQYCPSEQGAAARCDTNATSNAAAYRRLSQHTTARTELLR